MSKIKNEKRIEIIKAEEEGEEDEEKKKEIYTHRIKNHENTILLDFLIHLFEKNQFKKT